MQLTLIFKKKFRDSGVNYLKIFVQVNTHIWHFNGGLVIWLIKWFFLFKKSLSHIYIYIIIHGYILWEQEYYFRLNWPTVGGALTKGSEPLEMTSTSLTCFPLFFCKRALARALLSNLGAMSAKIKTSQGRLGDNINT